MRRISGRGRDESTQPPASCAANCHAADPASVAEKRVPNRNPSPDRSLSSGHWIGEMNMETYEPRDDLRFVVIGAGMAGILAGIKLREAGYEDITIYEKADRVGGTWRENTYPGLTCDVSSHSYTYTFEPNPEWSHRFPPGDEIEEYFEATTQKYGIDDLIVFNEEITRCEYAAGRWQLELASGTRDEADVVIAATRATTSGPTLVSRRRPRSRSRVQRRTRTRRGCRRWVDLGRSPRPRVQVFCNTQLKTEER